MMRSIGDILNQSGSDKNSPHGYGPVYDRLFPEERRPRVEMVLEIGVQQGNSIAAWLEAFPQAKVVGLDCSLDNGRFRNQPRVEIHTGDQRVPRTLLEAANGRQFDLIVDDASHVMADQLLSLFVLWPYLREGGVYVIEEFDMIPGMMVGCNPAHGLSAWVESCGLLRGAEVVAAPNRNGHNEPLLVVRK